MVISTTNVSREIPFYNLDMIISLGYRIKSKIATNFRKWATERLKEYMIKGFTMDDERLKGNGGGNISTIINASQLNLCKIENTLKMKLYEWKIKFCLIL